MSATASNFLADDWFESPLSPPLDFLLEGKNGGLELRFSRSSPASSHPDSKPTQFLEGLWEHDVAEAFFLEPETGRYLEVNLAPNGAWWACWHSGIREREQEQPDFQGVSAQGTANLDGWQASLFLPRELFSNLSTLKYNVTAILNSPAQTFHSLAKLSGEEPDFHQPKHFLPLE